MLPNHRRARGAARRRRRLAPALPLTRGRRARAITRCFTMRARRASSGDLARGRRRRPRRTPRARSCRDRAPRRRRRRARSARRSRCAIRHRTRCARELLDIGDDQRAALGRGGAAHAATERDPHARDLALERSEHELAAASRRRSRPTTPPARTRGARPRCSRGSRSDRARRRRATRPAARARDSALGLVGSAVENATDLRPDSAGGERAPR